MPQTRARRGSVAAFGLRKHDSYPANAVSGVGRVWSSQDSVDTAAAPLGSDLKLIGADSAEMAVTTGSIAKGFDVADIGRSELARTRPLQVNSGGIARLPLLAESSAVACDGCVSPQGAR